MAKYSIFDVIKDTVTGDVRATEIDLVTRRINICNECPEQNKILRVCKQCGCYIPQKSKYEQSSCPLGKW